jgi:hypothetical protein
VLQLNIGQQIPMPRFIGPVSLQPSAFRRSHRFVAERVLAGESTVFERSLGHRELIGSELIMAPVG